MPGPKVPYIMAHIPLVLGIKAMILGTLEVLVATKSHEPASTQLGSIPRLQVEP